MSRAIKLLPMSVRIGGTPFAEVSRQLTRQSQMEFDASATRALSSKHTQIMSSAVRQAL